MSFHSVLFCWHQLMGEKFTHFVGATGGGVMKQFCRRGPRILFVLASTHFRARFVLFHFSNFVYVRARMCLSINLTEEGWLRVAAEYISPLSTLHCSVWCWFWLEVSPLECVQDFLIKLDMKPCMHLVETSIFSPNHFIIRLPWTSPN